MKWEYTVLSKSVEYNPKMQTPERITESILGNLGQNHWEAISVSVSTYKTPFEEDSETLYLYAIFKRTER